MPEATFQRDISDTGEEIILSNHRVEARWREDAQLTLTLVGDLQSSVQGGPLIELAPLRAGGRARALGLGIDYDGPFAHDPHRSDDTHGRYTEATRRFPIAIQPLIAGWSVRIYDDHPFIRLGFTLRNTGGAPITVRRLFPFVCGAWWGGQLRIGAHQRHFAAYKNGWLSSSYAGGLPSGSPDITEPRRHFAPWRAPGPPVTRQPVAGTVDVVSDMIGMLGRPEQNEALLAGFLSANQWYGQLYLQRADAALAAAALLDDHILAPGAEVSAPPLILMLGRQSVLPTLYAEAVGRELAARHSPHPLVGWNTPSPHSATDATETPEAITVSLLPIHTLSPASPLTADAAHSLLAPTRAQRQPAPTPTPPAAVAPSTFALAPFTVSASSPLAAAHPDWLTHDSAGAPIPAGQRSGDALYGLDATHPEARAWLRQLITTIVADRAITTLTLSHLTAAALPGHRHDPTATRASALRDGLSVIRAAAGDQLFIIGADCPLLSAVGQLDALHIAPESAPHWEPHTSAVSAFAPPPASAPSLRNTIRNTLTRAWMRPALWHNVSGALHPAASTLTTDELHAHATAIGLTGSIAPLSDHPDPDPAALTPAAALFAALTPPLPERATPTNYFHPDIPTIVATPITRPWGRWLLVGIFNAEPTARIMRTNWTSLGLDPGAYHAVEFWSGAYLGLREDGLSLQIGPHGAAALAIRAPRNEPLLLSTSFHIGQGAVEVAHWSFDATTHTLTWTIALGRRTTGACTLWLPKAYTPGQLTTSARQPSLRPHSQGALIITAEIHGAATFTLPLLPTA